jgi:hypothetical protein
MFNGLVLGLESVTVVKREVLRTGNVLDVPQCCQIIHQVDRVLSSGSGYQEVLRHQKAL